MKPVDSGRSVLRRPAGLPAGLVLVAVTAAVTVAGQAPAGEGPQKGGELSQAEKAAVLGHALALASEERETSAGAEERLLGMGGRAVPYLCELVAPERKDVPRTEVVWVLGEIGDARASKTVAAMTSPGHPPEVRRTAVDALSKIGGEGVAERLVAILVDAFDEERPLARAAFTGLTRLAQSGDGDSPHAEEIADLVLSRLDEAEDDLRLWMIALLGKARHEMAVGRLVGLANEDEKDPEVRRQAARALGMIRDGEAGIPLVELLGDGDPRVRKEAANALGRLRLSEEQKEEVVYLLLEQLGSANEAGSEVDDLVRKALARITPEGKERNTYQWRVWGVEQDYGDPGRPEPPEDYEPPAPVVAPDAAAAAEPKPWLTRWLNPLMAVAAIAFAAGYLLLRPALIRRKAKAIDKKHRRRRGRL